jgi:hypothetical protein
VDFIGVEPGLVRIFVACFFVWVKCGVFQGNCAFGGAFLWIECGGMRGKGGLLMLVFGSSKILLIFGIYFFIGLEGIRVASLPSEIQGFFPIRLCLGVRMAT